MSFESLILDNITHKKLTLCIYTKTVEKCLNKLRAENDKSERKSEYLTNLICEAEKCFNSITDGSINSLQQNNVIFLVEARLPFCVLVYRPKFFGFPNDCCWYNLVNETLEYSQSTLLLGHLKQSKISLSNPDAIDKIADGFNEAIRRLSI